MYGTRQPGKAAGHGTGNYGGFGSKPRATISAHRQRSKAVELTGKERGGGRNSLYGSVIEPLVVFVCLGLEQAFSRDIPIRVGTVDSEI